MDFCILGDVRLYHETVKATYDILDHLVPRNFPIVKEYKTDYHSTLLNIGGPLRTADVKGVLDHSLFNHLYFLGEAPSLMPGGKDENLLLMRYKAPEMARTFKALYDNFMLAGIRPDHTIYAGGFTPHVTLAEFENKADCKQAIEDDGGRFIQELLTSSEPGPLVVGGFRLMARDEAGKETKIM